jgi:hypothetical protein
MNYKCTLCFFGNDFFSHQSSYSDRTFLVAKFTLNRANEIFWLSPKFIFGHCLENSNHPINDDSISAIDIMTKKFHLLPNFLIVARNI